MLVIHPAILPVERADFCVVAGRARQLNHKIRSRKNAIISRREAEATADDTARSTVHSRGGDSGHSRHASNGDRASNSPTGSGFVAVNRYLPPSDRPQHNGSTQEHPRSNGPIANGTPLHGASAATRAELLSKFHTTSDRSSSISDGDHSHRLNSVSRPSAPPSKTNSRAYADSMEYAGVLLNTASPVPIPNTPSSLLPYVKPSPADRFDDSGPYKADMMARMEQLNRGDRVQPPCDRCRRLHMDCLKNLTACMGCTKKHAKCSWKDVEEQELKDHPFVLRVKTAEEIAAGEAGSEGEGSRSGGSRSGGEGTRRERRREMTEVRDEELLGEDLGDEDTDMKDKGIAAHASTTNDSKDLLTSSPYPSMADPSRKTNAMSMSNITNSTMATSRPQSPQEPLTTPYQASQAQMQSLLADEINEPSEPNGHAQTEYEKDIYSQLNEATRASNGYAKTAITDSPRDDTVRVYTAGSTRHLSPFPPLQLDGVEDSVKQSPSPEYQQPQANNSPPQPQDRSPPVHQEQQQRDLTPPISQERHHSPRPPQMPISPPLSGVPSHATPTPNTPVLDHPLAAQPMQT